MEKIVFLKHIKFDQSDEKILGFFNSKNVNEIVGYYSLLPGFCDVSSGKFDYSKFVYTDKKYVFLLQIWDKNDEDICVYEKVFVNKLQAKSSLKTFINKNDMTNLDFQIEKYSIGQKYWVDGYWSTGDGFLC